MAKSAMPVSKAKTAYGLLSEIRKLIIEEPKRYDQEETLVIGRKAKEIHGSNTPSCGTVGCVAGWVIALKAPRSRADVLDRATEILGLVGCYDDSGQAFELFKATAAGDRYDDSTGIVTTETLRAHAQRGAEHIARFQKKYAKQLKAKRV